MTSIQISVHSTIQHTVEWASAFKCSCSGSSEIVLWMRLSETSLWLAESSSHSHKHIWWFSSNISLQICTKRAYDNRVCKSIHMYIDVMVYRWKRTRKIWLSRGLNHIHDVWFFGIQFFLFLFFLFAHSDIQFAYDTFEKSKLCRHFYPFLVLRLFCHRYFFRWIEGF